MEVVGKDTSELAQAYTLISNYTLSFAGSMSLKCAVELGMADAIHSHGRPMSLSELMTSLSIPPAKDVMLRRLMRVLVHMGVFAEQNTRDTEEECLYLLTPFSRSLLKEDITMSPFVLSMVHPIVLKSWYYMSEWFHGDESAPSRLAFDGISIWELLKERPEINRQFNDAMACDAGYLMKLVLSKYPEIFQGLSSLVDVAGGTGTAARAIAKAFPDMKVTILDQPHVVPTLPENDVVDAIGGNMFEYIPPANAMFLKSVLHDWDDKDCVKILKKCKEAIPSRKDGGKVIISDIVMNSCKDDPKVTETQIYYDMLMMVSHGKEREEHEWRKIFMDAGFTDYKIFPTIAVHSIMELYP